MKRIIGDLLLRIGAHMWEKGGFWNESQRYEDLTISGKLGYNLFCTGLKMMGISLNDIKNMISD